MKRPPTPFKREPVRKTLFTKLNPIAGRKKKQHSIAAADPEDFLDEGSSKISRNLTVIFLVHVVAIGLWFTHEQFFAVADAPPAAGASAAAAAPAARPTAAPNTRLSQGEQGYVVRRGENYATIALAHGVSEEALREANGNRSVQSGTLLRIPAREIRANLPVEVTTVGTQAATPEAVTTPAAQNDGLVDAVPADGSTPPRAQLVRPNITHPGAVSGSSYVVQSGDTVWRIANRFNVSQDALMRANKITDPKRLREGMTLVIP